MSHTPGPWQYRTGDFIGTAEEDYQTVAYLSDHRNRKPRPTEEKIANGHLIAAAPDLLAALEYYVSSSGNEPSLSVFERMVGQAIAKAKGST